MSSQPVARAAASELAACGAGRSPRMSHACAAGRSPRMRTNSELAACAAGRSMRTSEPFAACGAGRSPRGRACLIGECDGFLKLLLHFSVIRGRNAMENTYDHQNAFSNIFLPEKYWKMHFDGRSCLGEFP